MDHYITRIVENRIVIPDEMNIKYISTRGLAYIYHILQAEHFLTILNKRKVCEEDKKILKSEQSEKRKRYDRRHFYASLIRTKIKEHMIKLPEESIKYLGTDNIELRIAKGLLEVWPKN